MNRIDSVQDLIDELEYVQREWGNDSPIKLVLTNDCVHSLGMGEGFVYYGRGHM